MSYLYVIMIVEDRKDYQSKAMIMFVDILWWINCLDLDSFRDSMQWNNIVNISLNKNLKPYLLTVCHWNEKCDSLWVFLLLCCAKIVGGFGWNL